MQDEAKRETIAPVTAPDPFDLANLRIVPDYDAVAVKPLLLTVPVRRKPKNQHFVRVRPEPEFRADLTVIELEDDKDGVYLVTPSVAIQVHDECRRVSMFTAITRDGHTFLWAVPLPGPDGKDNEWNRSNREAVSIAMRSWVRVTSKHELGAYITNVAQCTIPDPIWPEESFKDLLRIAFRDRLIDRLDHPVLLRLKGQQL